MTTSAPGYLVDTNVLVYAYDAADLRKRDRATAVMRTLRAGKLGALSVQILGEFYTTVIREPLRPLTRDEARATSIRLCRSWPVLDLTVRTYLDAVRGVTEHRLAYWDALVWATARQNNIPYILTEDQQHGRLVEDVRYFDPFAPGFDMAMLS